MKSCVEEMGWDSARPIMSFNHANQHWFQNILCDVNNRYLTVYSLTIRISVAQDQSGPNLLT